MKRYGYDKIIRSESRIKKKVKGYSWCRKKDECHEKGKKRTKNSYE